MCRLILTFLAIGISTMAISQTDSSAYFLQKGIEEKTKGRRQESLKHFEKAFHYKKDDTKVVSELAAAYLDLRRYPQAKEKFALLEKLGDKSDSTYRQLMLLSYNMRQFDDVITYASQLKKVKPSEPTAFYLAKAYYAKEDLGKAIKYFDYAAKENPTNAEIPYTVARAYADMFNYKQSVEYFQKAIKLNENPRWIYELALMYYAIPDNVSSLKYMIEAVEKGYKKDNEYMQNLATAYINAGKPAEGLAILKELLQKRPSDMNLLNMIAEGYYDTKNYDEAINHFDKILEADKNNAEALYMIGMSFQKKGEKQKGQALCDKAIEMDPSLQSLKQKKQLPGGM